MKLKPLALWVALLGAPLVSLPAQAEDLLQVYDTAVTRDPGIQAAAAERDAALETRPQARALLLPNVNLNGSISRERFDSVDPTPGRPNPTYSTNKSLTLSLAQPLLHLELWQQLKQADAGVAQAEAQYLAAQQDLMVQVADLYFGVLKADDNLNFAQAEKRSTGRQLDQAKERFDVGLIAITDVHEAQARYDLAAAQEIQAKDSVESAREALRQVTGITYKALDRVKPKIDLAGPEPDFVAAWVEAAERANPALLAAEAQVEQSERQVRINRAGHYPTLDASADLTHLDTNFGGIASIKRNDASIGLSLALPIYKGGLTSSQVRQAVAGREQARYLYEQSKRDVERSTRDSFRGVNTSISQVKALKQALVSTQTALEAAEEGFKVGTRTIVDVLNAQTDYHRAERDYLAARYDYLLNQLRLKRAAGTLTREDIAQVNAWID